MNREKLLEQLGQPRGKNVLVEENQDVRDIMNLMKYKHNKCKSDYDLIASNFAGGSTRAICKRIWTFCKNNIQYEIESEALQTISSPQRILERGYGDCKHYALLSGGILDALNRQGYDIDWAYRYASYDAFDDTPGHVFTVVTLSDGTEIWIDPVLSEFDRHKFFFSAIDKRIGSVGSIGGFYDPPSGRSLRGLSAMDDRATGSIRVIGTVAQTGQIISKISPALAAVPVVGWIGAAAGEVVGFFLQVFGSRYSSSTQVRWLTQLFEYYVQGNCKSTSDNTVNEANVPTSQKWFAIVLGVPIYDRLRFNSLAGRTGWPQVDNDRNARVNDYMTTYPEVKTLVSQGQITRDQVLQATYIADTLLYSLGCGGWKSAVAAPSVIQSTTSNLPTNVVSPGNVGPATTSAGIFSDLATRFGIPEWVIFVMIGGGVLLLANSGKRKKQKR